MFCFPCDDADDAVQYLGLSCNKSKHYSTMVEACSTWIMELEERGKKDMYAKISPTWSCHTLLTQQLQQQEVLCSYHELEYHTVSFQQLLPSLDQYQSAL